MLGNFRNSAPRLTPRQHIYLPHLLKCYNNVKIDVYNRTESKLKRTPLGQSFLRPLRIHLVLWNFLRQFDRSLIFPMRTNLLRARQWASSLESPHNAHDIGINSGCAKILGRKAQGRRNPAMQPDGHPYGELRRRNRVTA